MSLIDGIYTNEHDFDNAVHLLMRSTIGPTLEEINLAVEIGLDATIDMLFENTPLPDPPGGWIYHSLPPNFGVLTSTQKDSIRDEWENRFWLMSIWWMDLMKNSDSNTRKNNVGYPHYLFCFL